jgi:subfamily B ATP-binding cassette protein MsbA
LTKLLWRRDLSGPLSEFLGIATVTFLLWYGSREVFNNQLTPESFFAFIFAFFQVIEPSKSFSKAYYTLQKGLAAVDRVDDLLLIQNPIYDHQGNKTIAKLEDTIVFDNISFSYDNSELTAINDVSIQINKGEVIALVGPSGAGKSTLADLLLRFYDVDKGEIRIDGTSITQYNLSALRSLFGIVSQEAILFNDTIRNNITFGGEYTDEDITKAAEIANAAEFIDQLPEQYNTQIGDRGNNLSGGQRQRITIARAVLKDPDILILDEATSALDSASERLVQKALEEIVVGRTTIIIAHRLSTIRSADKIIVLDEGKIVEMGSHTSLIAEQGAYARFVNMQTFT